MMPKRQALRFTEISVQSFGSERKQGQINPTSVTSLKSQRERVCVTKGLSRRPCRAEYIALRMMSIEF